MTTADSSSATSTKPQEPGRWPALPAGPSHGAPTERARHHIARTCRELRFVADRPPCLLEHLAYARRGEWTEELDGPLRAAAEVYAWLVAIPLSIAAYLLAWCAARPGRLVTALAVGLAATSALARLPVVGALIPGWVHL